MGSSCGTLVLDNNDSFTWNLVHLLEQLGDRPRVVRAADFSKNSGPELRSLLDQRPPRVLISPGPGTPDEAQLGHQLLSMLSPDTPLLGVCLGLQTLATYRGARWRPAPRPVHGRTELISHDDQGIFSDLPNPLKVTRYHSLVIDEATLAPHLEATAWAIGSQKILMGARDRQRPWEGVQFHPESFLTEGGLQMLQNFLSWE